MNHVLQIRRLGRVEYSDGLRLQELFGESRAEGHSPDTLLLLEHSPVLTLGRAAKRANILAPDTVLAEMGVEVFETSRGGDVTYHGPGQIVGYPIVKLEGKKQDVRRYVRDLEEALILTLADYGIEAGRIEKWTGVWVRHNGPNPAKIAAIGVHISKWQTSHGFALNVSTNLSHFNLIVPCGIREAAVTSMERELGRRVEMREVEEKLQQHLANRLELTPEVRDDALACVSVTVLSPDRENVLLLRRTPAEGGIWQQVTGTVEASETLEETARRELFEETGARLSVLPLGYTQTFAFAALAPPRLARMTAFVAQWQTQPSPVKLQASEHDAFEWVSVSEAMSRLPFAGLRRSLQLAVSHSRERR